MHLLEFKERKEHGSIGFPVELYPVDEYHPQFVMVHHWHLEYEIIRVLSGTFHYVIEQEEANACNGDILLVNSSYLHSGIPDHNCVYECIVFDINMLIRHTDEGSSLLQDFYDQRLLIDHLLPQTDETAHIIVHSLFDAMANRKPGYQLVVQGLLYQLFGRITEKGYYSENWLKKLEINKKIRQLKNALEIIENDYMSPLSLKTLADAAGMSPKYFCQFFREMTGRSPIDYLNRHRVEIACVHLAAGSHSVTELSYECGFEDLSYFIRVFKRYKGTTPRQYLKRHHITPT